MSFSTVYDIARAKPWHFKRPRAQPQGDQLNLVRKTFRFGREGYRLFVAEDFIKQALKKMGRALFRRKRNSKGDTVGRMFVFA